MSRANLDEVEFRLATEELGIGDVLTVTPYVNGISLVEWARQVELRPATATGEPDLAGAYAGLVIHPGNTWTGWYRNDDPHTWFGDGDSCLLGCTCGDTGCWPLTAQVRITGSQITWADFRTGHRPWDLRELGPFVFAVDQYDAALARAAT